MSRRHQVILAAALIVAGLLLAFFYIYQRPRTVAERAVRHLVATPKQQFTADLQLQNSQATQAALKEKGTVEVHLQGTYDRSATRPALASTVDVTIKTESVSLQVSGEARLREDKFYLLISKIPPLWPVLQNLKGQWVELPRGGTKIEASPAEALPTGQAGSAKEGQLFLSVKRLGNNQYQALATQAAVVRFMNALAEIMGTELSNQQLSELQRGIGQLEQLPVTLTITPFSHRLQRLETTITPPNGNNVHFVLQLERETKAAAITVPDGAVTLESALKKR